MTARLDAPADDTVRWFPVWAVAQILNRSHETIRTWIKTDRIPWKRDETGTLLVDGRAATLYHEQTATRRRIQRVQVVDNAKPSKPSSVLQTYAQTKPGPSRFGLSHVRVREGVSLPDETPTEIVIPVRLDLTAAEAQLAEFCDHVRASLGEAVTSGLAVQALTVALQPPTDQP